MAELVGSDRTRQTSETLAKGRKTLADLLTVVGEDESEILKLVRSLPKEADKA